MPSIAPTSPDDLDIYLVLDDFGSRLGRAWREIDEERTDRRTLLTDLIDGQYSDPARVVVFNTAEGAESLKAIGRAFGKGVIVDLFSGGSAWWDSSRGAASLQVGIDACGTRGDFQRCYDTSIGPVDRKATWPLTFDGEPGNEPLVGKCACSRKGSFVPTGRLRTMPGFAIVADFEVVGFPGKTMMKEVRV
jgi:hypothetical protein